MRKYYVFLFFLSFVFQNLCSRPVTPEEALNLANRFWSSVASQSGAYTRASSAELTLVYTSVVYAESKSTRAVDDRGLPTYYVFNAGQNGGFVIVAADDRARSILAYSLTGSFGLENQPLQISRWLSVYDKEIAKLAQIASYPESASHAFGPYTSSISTRSALAPAIEPLLGSIAWNQDAPFNNKCPFDNNFNQTAPVGCVATAAAQIMKYYNYPEMGSGSKAYTSTTLNKRLTANFGETTYDWANMKDDYNSPYNEVQAEAIAVLSYHVGVSCNMDYSAQGSGATAKDIANGLKNYFLYDRNMEYAERTHYKEDDWSDFLKAELNERRPILYFGEGPGGGHAFVCDGYDTNGLFHFNWGWGGISNGYYQISALEPQDLGIGSGMGAYNHYQSILFGIQPPNNASTHLDRVHLNGTFKIENTETERDGGNKATVGFFNYGLQSFSGEVILGLYKGEELSATLASATIARLSSLGGGTKDFTFDEFSIPASVENGTYRLMTAQKGNDADDYTLMLAPVNSPNYYIVEVTDSKVAYIKPEFAPKLSMVMKPEVLSSKLYRGRKASFRVTVKNDGEEFYSYMGILLQKRSEDQEKERQYIGMFPTRIPKGATRTFEFSDVIEASAGEYDIVAVCDVDNAWSNRWWDAIGPNEFKVTDGVILAEPDAPVFSLASTVKIAAANGSSTIGVNESVVITTRISNTGGYGDGKFAVLFFNDKNEYLGNSSILELSIDSRKLASFKLTQKLSYPAGQYGILVASVSGNNAIPMLPEMFNRTTFWITQGTGIEKTTTGAPALSCYESEGNLYLKVDAEKRIKAAGITDVSGKLVRTVATEDNSTRIFVGDLPSGLYIIQAETDQGVLRCKWMKN